MSQQNAKRVADWYIANCDVDKQPTFEEGTSRNNHGYLIISRNGQLKTANPIYEHFNGGMNLLGWLPFGEHTYTNPKTILAYQPIQIPQVILDDIFGNPKAKRSTLYKNHHQTGG